MSLTKLISSGSELVIISTRKNLKELTTVQVVSDNALDAPIKIKLKQSNKIDFADGGHDLPETPITTDSGANSNLLQTSSFYCDYIAVDISVMTATLGTLTITTNYKD